MKQIRIFVMLAALCMILPLASYAQEHRHSQRGEISIENDMDTQVSLYVTTEKHGRLGAWTYKPGQRSYLSHENVRLRVSGEDEIEIGDWGKAYIRDVAKYMDGAWTLRLRHARREMRELRHR